MFNFDSFSFFFFFGVCACQTSLNLYMLGIIQKIIKEEQGLHKRQTKKGSLEVQNCYP